MSEPTPASLLANLSREQRALLFERLRQRKERAEGGAARIPRRPPEADPPPASFAQERLWLIDRLQPELSAYNIPLALRIDGEVSPAILRAILGEVVRRHEALRTTFREEGGRPVQVIAPAGSWRLPLVDLSALPAAARESQARRLAQEEVDRPFDLERGPLLRAALLRLGPAGHALLLNMHHIVSDGWSLGVIVREITQLHGAAAAGAPSPLPELEIQYADFAVWQRGWLQGEVLERQLDYWRERLAGVPATLELPADRPLPAARDQAGARLRLPFGADLQRDLPLLARQHEATPFMVLFAAFQTLLARLTGADDLTVGTPIANRNRSEIEPLIGFFVNTLVLRSDLAGDPAFAALLARVRKSTLEAYAHQDLPFEQVVEALNPERHLATNPLFQVLFAVQNAPVGVVDLPGLSLSPLPFESKVALFDLEVSFWELAGGLEVELAYSTELFDPATVRRLAASLETLLRALLADPAQSVWRAPLLSPAERQQLAVEWNDTPAVPPAGTAQATLPALFAAQAARTPDAVAVVCGHEEEEEELTYAELARRARRVAGRLLRAGVPPGSRVAVAAERSLGLIPALLGILQAGCAYLPVDPELPEERRRFLLEDAGAVSFDFEENQGPQGPQDPQEDLPEVTPGHLAYVIYTSGSTGTPKGVEVTHGNVARLVTGADYAPMGPGETLLQVVNVAFDVSTFEIWAPLVNGGRVAVFPGRRPALDELARAIARHQVTTLWLTAGLFHQMVQERLEALRPLRRLLAGGDVLAPGPVRRALRGLPGCVLVNGYGPTENTVFTTCHAMTAADLADPRLASTVPIGKPVHGTTAHVLDGALQPVPMGIWGELYTGGEGVARGYLGRPALTAERFLPDPFAATPGARFYRTGDMVRRRPAGVLEFLGRRDGQVKIRGFRIELGEIEAALDRHPKVREAIVVPWEVAGDRRLAAYVVSDPGPGGQPLDPSELRWHLTASLPEPMIPSAFVLLDRLPLTPNGKVDRRALPSPDPAAGRTRDYRAPANPVEEILAAACAGLMGLDRVGMRDNFFDLGGHSLLATRLVSRLREAFGVELPLRAVFEAPTLAALAARLQKEIERGRAAPRTPLLPVPRDRPLPLSFAQERLWFLYLLAPASPVYNMSSALRLAGRLDAAALAAALSEVLRRHEALRTTFRTTATGAVQEIHPWAPQPQPLIDLAGLPGEIRDREARRIATAESARPFDLGRGPLLRTLLARLGPEEHLALWSTHHITADGWSLSEVLVPELTRLYAAAIGHLPSPLPEPPVQYADYAVWQRDWLRGEVLEEQLGYWRTELAGLVPLDLPADRPRPAAPSGRGGAVAWELGVPGTAALARLARAGDATLFMALFAAFAATLHRETGATELPVGLPVANRSRSEVEGLIGFFVNTLVLRGDLAGDPDFPALLRRSRATALGALSHQDIPFERLVDELGLPRNPHRPPLLRVVFQLLTAPSQEGLELPGVTLTPFEAGAEAAKFDLVVNLFEVAGGVSGAFQYDADLFDGATIARLAGHFGALLGAWTAAPDRRLSDLPLLTPAERHQLLAEWNPAPRPSPVAPVALHSRFEAQVDRAPGAVALSWEGQRTTYAELDARANRIARHLRASGVRPGDRVALLLERSAEMVAALLGVLKAGAAYVPVDPTYPAERIVFVREDSAAALTLTAADLEAVASQGDDEDAERPEIPVDPAFPAYVIYTSGSTGTPKGVVVTHANVDRLFTTTDPWFGFTSEDVWTLFHSYAFDFSVWEIWGALLHGGRLVVVPYWVSRSPEDFHRLLGTERVTVLNQTPSAFRQLLWAQEAVPERLLPLRYVVFGGEALEPAALAPWFARYGDRKPRLINMYGITETTVHVTWRPVGEGDLAGGSLIGQPIPDLAVHLLDPDLQPVPIGVPGEIHVGGAGLAQGYLDRPDLTAGRFVPDPFAGTPGARLYRSGDLARRRPDGDLEYLGRADQQVKIRGFRIELGEIEAALTVQPGVREAVVLAREDGPAQGSNGERRLVAYLVGDPGDPAVLRQALGERLPDYMVPAAFVVLDALPLTGNGKVDRRALPAPEAATPSAPRELRAPSDPLERFLAEQFREVLGLPADREIGVDEDFFELGGTSITSAIFIHRLQEALGETVHVVIIFDHPTVATLAAYVREHHPEASWDETGEPAARPRVLERDVLVPLQAGSAEHRPLFFVHSVGGEVVAYRELIRRLGRSLPVWGLQSPDPPLETIPEMAERYIAAVRSVQPAGPYRIAGWSMGAAVVYEMAHQLELQGEAADLVGLIDASSPLRSAEAPRLQDIEMLSLFALALADLHDVQIEGLELPPELKLATLGLSDVDLSGMDLDAALDITLDLGRQAGLLPPNLERAELRRLFERFKANRNALAGYRPPPYAGTLHLFRATDQIAGETDPTLGWDELAPGRVRIFDSPGDHYKILREEVEALAGCFRGLLG